MIYPITMHAAKCDGCGDKWDNGDCVCAYEDKEHVRCSVSESGWHIKDDGKTYCPDCWSYDDEDNIIFKTPPQTQQQKA